MLLLGAMSCGFSLSEYYSEQCYCTAHSVQQHQGYPWHLCIMPAQCPTYLSTHSCPQGNCVESFNTVFEDLEEDSVAGLTKRGTQCLLLLQSEPADHSTLVDLLSEVKSGVAP